VFARAILLAASLIWADPAVAQTQSADAPLVLDTKIPLGEVSGRIDHLGVDVKRRRLFVAELGNDSLAVVDLATGKVLRTIPGFSEPQGVAYVPFADSVYAANGGDGSVRVLRGEDFAPIGHIELGNDADNVRVDAEHHRVLVGYGEGALAVIDPATRTKTSEIRLKGHPESLKPAPGSSSMCPMRARSRWWTSRPGPTNLSRHKARGRISRWRSIAMCIGLLSFFAALRP
jgi:YVTN family beta-propeller protein